MQSSAFIFILAICGADVPTQLEVRTIADRPVVGDIRTIGADGDITLADGTVISAGEWYSIRRAGVLPPWPREPHAEFNNGDRIRGSVAGADGDALRLVVTWGGPAEQQLKFPLSSLRAVWLRNRPDDIDPHWLTTPRKRDVLVARNGDLAQGALTSIDVSRSQVRFQADGQDRELLLSKVVAIGFNSDLARARQPKGPFYRLTLADGTRIGVTSVAFDGRLWTAQTTAKEMVKILPDRIVSVDVEQGRVVPLADLKPVMYQYQSQDGESYSWAAHRSAGGQAMKLKAATGQSTFDRGLGLHAECTITYALDGKYRRFETLAGLDAQTGIRGDAVLSIQLDGKEVELPSGGRLTNVAEPLPIKVDVTNAKRLTIMVRQGNGGIVQDHVNLAEARLVP
jgi:hypothetical protein